jgi:hypothetical protein
MVKEPEPTGRAKGGLARARGLTAAERKTIAQKAAASRWSADEFPTAIASSEDTPMMIADQAVDCYVLEDGTRVLSTAGFLRALGRNPRAATRSLDVPPWLQGQALKPFVTQELLEAAHPVTFRMPNGFRATGYRAEVLPQVCEVYLKARDAKVLAPNQRRIAIQADILMRGLATVGIIALVDEATHYQEMRTKDALSRILEAFVAKELQGWIKTFPNEFYANLFRLRGLDYPTGSVRRPQYFGMLTNDIVYSRLAPGVLDELKEVTPRDEQGRRKHQYFRRLTSNIGYPKLREHLGSVVTLMKLSKSWHEFRRNLDTIHPRYDKTQPMPFDYDDDQGL